MSILIRPAYSSYSNPIYLSSEKIRVPDSFSLRTALLHLDPFLLQRQCGHTCGLHGQVRSSYVLSTSFHADAFIPQSHADVLNSFCRHFFQILSGLELEFWKYSKKKNCEKGAWNSKRKHLNYCWKGNNRLIKLSTDADALDWILPADSSCFRPV